MKILYEDILSTYNKIKPFLKVTETSYSEQISKKFNCNLFIKFENSNIISEYFGIKTQFLKLEITQIGGDFTAILGLKLKFLTVCSKI